MSVGEQFKNLDSGMDEIYTTFGEDRDVLVKMNQHLAEIFDEENRGNNSKIEKTEGYQKTLSKYREEIKGNIYANIQDRMQDINKAFDSSFKELVSSYNNTKDVDKYSVIYTDGDYKNDTLGVTDYDYTARGLLYMKEYEGIDFGGKAGYSFGFADTKFKFDKDDGNNSKEEVYSLRAGVHGKKQIDDDISLLSKITLGYNRHRTDRRINLDTSYKAKGRFNTYTVEFDNKLNKSLYRDFSKDINLYGLVNFEYGRISNFKERGILPLKVRHNHYFSSKAGVGLYAG